MRHALAAGLLVLAWLPAATAQTPPQARCRQDPLPFAASDANRLSTDQLKQLLTGKTLSYVREDTRNKGVYVKLSRELRADGSFVSICEFSRSREGGWKPCQNYGSDGAVVPGHRDVGVWRIADRNFCFDHSAFKQGVCFAIHRQGAVLAARITSGPRTYCGEGAVVVQ